MKHKLYVKMPNKILQIEFSNLLKLNPPQPNKVFPKTQKYFCINHNINRPQMKKYVIIPKDPKDI